MEKHRTKITSKSIEQSGLPSDYKKAIAEYIWNGFDANTSQIEVDFNHNETGFLFDLSITDNGSGIKLEFKESVIDELEQKGILFSRTAAN